MAIPSPTTAELRFGSVGSRRDTPQPPGVVLPTDTTPRIPAIRTLSYELPDGFVPKGLRSSATLFEQLVMEAKKRVPEPFARFMDTRQVSSMACKSLFDAGYVVSPDALAGAVYDHNAIVFAEEYYPLVSPGPAPTTPGKASSWLAPKVAKATRFAPLPFRVSPLPKKTLVYLRDKNIPLESVWGHEAGHHLDKWSGEQYGLFQPISSTPEFQAATHNDMRRLSADQQKRVLGWANLAELFTESCMELFGLSGCHRLAHHPDEPMDVLFPGTQNWIYRVLQQLHLVPSVTTI